MGNKKFSKPRSFLFLYSITYEKFQIKFSNKNLSSLPVIDYILSLSLLFPFFRFLEKSLELVWTILRKSDGKWSSHFRIEQVNRKSKEKEVNSGSLFWIRLPASCTKRNMRGKWVIDIAKKGFCVKPVDAKASCVSTWALRKQFEQLCKYLSLR